MKKILLVTSIFLFSCDIGEIAIEPHVAGAIQIGIAELEDNYKNQIFYNLSQNQLGGQKKNYLLKERIFQLLQKLQKRKVLLRRKIHSLLKI